MSFVPDDFEVPRELVAAAFRLEPLGPEHNEGDYRAWTASIEHIQAHPGFAGRTWPQPDMTLAENLGDLAAARRDFAARSGFTYTVLADEPRRDRRLRLHLPAADGQDGRTSGPGSALTGRLSTSRCTMPSRPGCPAHGRSRRSATRRGLLGLRL